MLEVTSRQERYLLDARAYAPDLCTLYGIPACPGSSPSPPVPNTVSPNYTVTIPSVTATPPGYTIQAAPIGGQADNDANCGTLTIDSTGAKAASGPGGVANCWNR